MTHAYHHDAADPHGLWFEDLPPVDRETEDAHERALDQLHERNPQHFEEP